MRINILVILSLLSWGVNVNCYASQEPWRVNSALDLPAWLDLSGQHRIRYETLDQQFRARVNGKLSHGGDQALVFRTLIHARIDLGSIRFGAELEDSRIELGDQGTASGSGRLTTTVVNPLELLQAYVELPIANVLQEGSRSLLRAGRITMDVGSRRLVARNRFRNTLNAFTGIDWQWRVKNQQFRAFYILPIQRLVDGDLRDNHEKFDREHAQIRFWGAHYEQSLFGAGNNAEVFLFGLNENDAADINTRERDLYTFGWRLWRKPEVNTLDYQFEGAYQLGESKQSVTSNKTLDHKAYFHHAEVGYSFTAPLSPRLIIQYDYASGDNDPSDNTNNRFDTLYGARRFDFGPTSIYGPFARSNINTPGLRLALKPCPNIKTMFSLRGFWRASTRDAWTGANINGDNTYIGTQVEARIRWEVLPKNIRLESGVAYIFAGDLIKAADKQDTIYAYSQVALIF